MERQRAEIATDGPITFARFMERALYEPDLGYYATSTARPTRAGDFLTAPELHPIFGHALARNVDAFWHELDRPDPFVLREYGPGSGALFLSMLEELTRAGSHLASAIRYQPVDLPGQLAVIEQRLTEAGHLGLLSRDAVDETFTGCVIANEYIDALPVHVVVREGDGLREVLVDWRDGRFVEVIGSLSDARLADWFSGADSELGDGHRAEVNLAMLDWLISVGTNMTRGRVIVIDYGAPAAELHSEARRAGTLRAFRGQHVSSDALSAVGHQDITAHVDLDALARGARAAGFVVSERSRQAEFLLANGLDELYAAARAEADQDWNTALTLRSAVRRLLDPQALGGYQVVVLGREG